LNERRIERTNKGTNKGTNKDTIHDSRFTILRCNAQCTVSQSVRSQRTVRSALCTVHSASSPNATQRHSKQTHFVRSLAHSFIHSFIHSLTLSAQRALDSNVEAHARTHSHSLTALCSCAAHSAQRSHSRSALWVGEFS